MPILPIIFTLAIIGVIMYFIQRLPMDQNIRTVINVVVILLICYWLIGLLGIGMDYRIPVRR